MNTRQIERIALDLYFDFIIAPKTKQTLKPFPGSFGVKPPPGYQVHGIDVSVYQKKINWEKVASLRSGKDSIDFVIIKATEGRTRIDPCFDYNWKKSRKNHILRAAYHFYVCFSDSRKQARNFIEVVNLKKGDLPPVLDIEQTGPYGSRQMLSGIKNWLNIIEQEYGMKPIIYTYYGFYARYLKGNKDFKSYPVWLAHYAGSNIPDGTRWNFWQYTEKAMVEGIVKEVDMNVFCGSKEELMAMTKK